MENIRAVSCRSLAGGVHVQRDSEDHQTQKWGPAGQS